MLLILILWTYNGFKNYIHVSKILNFVSFNSAYHMTTQIRKE